VLRHLVIPPPSFDPGPLPEMAAVFPFPESRSVRPVPDIRIISGINNSIFPSMF
jgi:hypothetical protein